MKTHIAHDAIEYTGAQLRSGWIRASFGIAPDAIVAFRGPCDVAREHMIDLEDLAAGETIVARDMLHVIVEHVDPDLGRVVLRQRLLAAIAGELLAGRWGVADLRREGDDLYVGEGDARRKLSVSIATTSAAGTSLIHLGIDVDATGAPVPAVGLPDLGVDPGAFARELVESYAAEMAGIAHAQTKVREAR